MVSSAKITLLAVAALGLVLGCVGYGEDYNAYAEQVTKLLKDSREYTFPVDNEKFFETNEKSATLCGNEEYDFIIVGTGSAGGVLANRLTEKNFKVLAIEAGGEPPELSNMLGVNVYLHRTQYNWGYNTTRQKNMCLGSRDQRCGFPRGKMLGGSSSINFGMYVRGHHQDFDKWEALGNPGWSYEDVLPYFRKPENATFRHKIDRDYHGFDGPQSIGVPEDTPILTQALVDCHIDLGKTETDYNGKDQNGVSRLQFFLDQNVRASSNHAFIKPAQNRPNLYITTNALVSKILIKNKTAYGVRYIKNGVECVAKAKKEVLLSAGAINSPQILMLSGIGPEQELRKHGIDIVKVLPVGRYLQDHQFFPGVFYRTNQTFYNNSILENVKLWTKNLRPLTPSLGQQTVSFWNFLGPKDSQPEIELFFFGPPMVTSDIALILGYTDEYIEIFKSLNGYTDINVNVELLHPRSEGTVTLRSKDPRDFPVIDPNYFSDPEGEDIENMYKGVEVALKFNETETFKGLHAELFVIPYPECDAKHEKLSKDWWYCAIKTLSSTLFHPVCTTRMGPDPKTSVVNAELKVHGIKNLRVVDAGVIPDHISGHPNAAVVMIAEKTADAIKKEHSSPNFENVVLDTSTEYQDTVQPPTKFDIQPPLVKQFCLHSKTLVENAELNVHGIKNLRVVEAEVMPDHIPRHPNGATVMIAEKTADVIKKELSSPNSEDVVLDTSTEYQDTIQPPLDAKINKFAQQT